MANKLFEILKTGSGNRMADHTVQWLAPDGRRFPIELGKVYDWTRLGSDPLPGFDFISPFKVNWRSGAPAIVFLNHKMEALKYAELPSVGRCSVSWQGNWANAYPLKPENGKTFWSLCIDPGIVEYVSRERFDALMSEGQRGWHVGANRNWAVQFVGQSNLDSSKPVVTRILSVESIKPSPEDLQELRRALILYHLGQDADENLAEIWDKDLEATLKWVGQYFAFSQECDRSWEGSFSFCRNGRASAHGRWLCEGVTDDEDTRTLQMLLRRWGCEPFIERFGNPRIREWLAAHASAEAAAKYLLNYRKLTAVESHDGYTLRFQDGGIQWLKSSADYIRGDRHFSRLLAVEGCFQVLVNCASREVHARSTGQPQLYVPQCGDKIAIWDGNKYNDFQPARDWFTISRSEMQLLNNAVVCLSVANRGPGILCESANSCGLYRVLRELETGEGYFGQDDERHVLALRVPEGESRNFLFVSHVDGRFGAHVWGVTVTRNVGGTLEFAPWDNGYLYELRYPASGVQEYVRHPLDWTPPV